MSDRHDVLDRLAPYFPAPDRPLEGFHRRRARKDRNRRIGTAALALVIAAAGLLGLVRLFDPAPATVPAGTGSWTRLEPTDPSVFAGADLRAVTTDGDRYVAVGNVPNGASPVWTSTDGFSWSRVPASQAPDSPELWDVAAGDNGFVAVGVGDVHGRGGPAAWFSADGIQWSGATVRLPTALGNGDGMFGVVATDVGFLGWGQVRGHDRYVWTSSDGRTWDPASQSPFGGVGEESIGDIASGGRGYVAVGQERRRNAQTGAAVAWSSADGRSWVRETPPGVGLVAKDWTSMSSVVPGGPGLIAFGRAGATISRATAAEWTSPDGVTWTRNPSQPSFEGAQVSAVAASPRGFVAVGYTYPVSHDPAGFVWTSVDGLTWNRVEQNATFSSASTGRALVEDVAIGQHATVAVGVDERANATFENGGISGAVWVSNDSTAAEPTQATSPSAPPLAHGLPGRLAFSSGGRVFVVDPGGTISRATGGTEEQTSLVTWSADGSNLLVRSALLKDPAHPCICLIPRNQMTVRPSGGTGLNFLAPWGGASFSPDGARVVFEEHGGLYVADANGRGAKWIAPAAPGSFNREPAWSPDGSKIAFVSRNSGSPDQIYIMNADGTGVRQLTTPDGSGDANREPAWSPDGTKLAFTRYYGDASSASDIYTMNADGTGVRRLIQLPSTESRPSWSPDGSTIAFASDGAMYVVNPDGSELKRIGYEGAHVVDSGPIWQPKAP